MAAMSVAFRKSLEAHVIRPNELRLALMLCLDTFDQGFTEGKITLDEWARRMDLRDSKGLRPDKVATLLKTLNELGLVDVNPAQATFEPRPDADLWPRARLLRARAISTPSAEGSSAPAAAELALRDERELPEAMNQLSRELAIGQAPAAAAATSSDFSDDRRRNPTNTVSSEKSDDAVQRLTFNRLNVETNKRLTLGASEKSDDACQPGRDRGELVRQMRKLVRDFVGDEDFFRCWDRAYYVWENLERVEQLERSYNYFTAGVRSGEITVKTTRGAGLWSQVQIDWRKYSRDQAEKAAQ